MKRVRFYDSPVLSIQMPLWRSRLVLILLMLGFFALIAKALYLQGLSTEFLQQQGERRYERNLVLPATRGKIFDRTGSIVLATSVPARAIWALPEDAKDATAEQLSQLAKLLGLSVGDIQGRIRSNKSFVYLKRQITVELADQIKALKIPGIHQQDEEQRPCPGRCAGHHAAEHRRGGLAG